MLSNTRFMFVGKFGDGFRGWVGAAAAIALGISGCGGATTTGEPSPTATAATATTQEVTPAVPTAAGIQIDGSSTVFPITEAIAKAYKQTSAGKAVAIDSKFSGTGGGFKKFCAGETDANNASRQIKTGAESEDELCTTNSVEYIELKVALDGLAVVVNPENDFVDCLSVAELNAIWGPDSTVTTWADVRAGWPAEEIELYGPGADSGTFDYFTEVINGEAKASRSDYTASEDDNTLVQGISGSKYAFGYFGLAYVTENVGKVKAVPVDGGAGCTMPSADAVNDGTYSPLGRPLFVYPSVAALARPEVAAFFRFYLENTNELSEAVGFIGLNDADLSAAKATLEATLK